MSGSPSEGPEIFGPEREANSATLGTVCPNVASETNGKQNKNRRFAGKKSGARRIRTADLLGAIQALCQLSYSPEAGWEVDPMASQATG
jgi:hypothetical protein